MSTDLETTDVSRFPQSPTATTASSPTSPTPSSTVSISGTVNTVQTAATNTTVAPSSGNNPAAILFGGGQHGPSMTEEELNSLLHRLSTKQSVQSILILSREDGAIIRSTFTSPSPSSSSHVAVNRQSLNFSRVANNRDSLYSLSSSAGFPNEIEGGGGGNYHYPNETCQYAAIVWKYVKSTEELVSELDGLSIGVSGTGSGTQFRDRNRGPTSSNTAGADGVVVNGKAAAPGTSSTQEKGITTTTGGEELKLLRLRTRRHELVIVPDARFILVVVHAVGPMGGGTGGERGSAAGGI